MTDSGNGNAAQAEYWEGRAASWVAIEEFTSLVTSPFGRRAMDRLGLEPGSRVLDVGCGTGSTTVELARRVAPGGTVVGLDISPTMLDAARATAEGVDGIELVVGDAQTDDLGAGSFDGVFSQFGVMFFADPVAAFTNLRRSLRDGGRVAFSCWQEVAANEWMIVPGMAVVGVTGELPQMPGPGEPGPFSLADPALIERILGDAGFRSIEVARVSDVVEVGADRLDFVVEASTRVGAVRAVFDANDDPAWHQQLREAVRRALEERVADGRLRLASAANVVSADA